MSRDAKLGLVIGIAVVIVIAVVFFRREPAAVKAGTETAAAVKPKGVVPAFSAPAAADAPDAPAKGGRTHTVVAGDTLSSLAERYYHDRRKFVTIYDANQHQLNSPDELTPGMVLVLPDLPER